MDWMLIVAIISVLLTVLGGLFGVYTTLSNKIERSYDRMDENKEEYYQKFLLKEVHDESKKNLTDNFDQKFLSQMKLFETHLTYVVGELKGLKQHIDKMNDKQ